jgi:hypothetical protein
MSEGKNMKPIIAIIALLTWAGAAQAQQQITPSQMAIQIDNAVNGLASSVEVLQTQLKEAQAKVCPAHEPKKPDAKK